MSRSARIASELHCITTAFYTIAPETRYLTRSGTSQHWMNVLWSRNVAHHSRSASSETCIHGVYAMLSFRQRTKKTWQGSSLEIYRNLRHPHPASVDQESITMNALRLQKSLWLRSVRLGAFGYRAFCAFHASNHSPARITKPGPNTRRRSVATRLRTKRPLRSSTLPLLLSQEHSHRTHNDTCLHSKLKMLSDSKASFPLTRQPAVTSRVAIVI